MRGVKLNSKKKIHPFSTTCLILGIALMAFGAGWYVMEIIQDYAVEQENEKIIDAIQTEAIENSNQTLDSASIGENEYIGIIEIPSISLKMPVLSTCEGGNLDKGICLYYRDKSIVIGGHNRTSQFRSLYALKGNDLLYFYDLSMNKKEYKLIGTEFLMPNEVEKFVTDEYSVTLFTCDWGDERRFVLRFQ